MIQTEVLGRDIMRCRSRCPSLWWQRVSALLALLVALLASSLLSAQERPGRFIALSDLHLDVFADPILVDGLADADPVQWAQILGRATHDRYGHYRRDATWPLVESALDQMRAVEPDPPFVILTGDLFAHEFRKKFEASAARRSEDDYRAFVRKTLKFLSFEIMRRFPGKPVFLSLGNEDSDCGDYRLAPDGGFLHDSLAAAAELAGIGDDPVFRSGWLAGHGYDIANRAIPKLRIVSVNSVFLSVRYRDTCGGLAPASLGDAVLTWLTERLGAARQAGEKVWLLFHIPPGADPYATVRNGGCPAGLTPMWAEGYASQFVDLLRDHADIVTATFAGHTHMDEFRVIGRDGRIHGFTLNTPGISPIFGQNPGFHVYSYGASGELVDRETWYTDDFATVARDAKPTWRREYRFSERWSMPGLNTATLSELADRIGNDERARAAWFSIYPVGRTAMWRVPGGVASLPAETFRAYDCAMRHTDAAAYRRCLCGAPQ
jgi:hypothetical protein